MAKKTPLLVVCGPTASGKTRLSIDLALRFSGEIISADSMQIYKGMTIGTAKPDAEEMRGVPHHLIDFLEADEKFSVAEFVRLAKLAVEDIASRGKMPVLTGGTGLYISSLIDNIHFDEIESDEQLRGELQRLADEKGTEYLHQRLAQCDPALAEKLHPNNLGRVIRALEVYERTGTPMSEMQQKSRQHPSEYDLRMLGLRYQNRETLYARINTRVDRMMERGLLAEAQALFRAEQCKTSAQAIGYKELFRYFRGEESLEDAVERIKRETRRYAKRQLTWLNRDERIQWIDVDEYESYDKLLAYAVKIAESFWGDRQWAE